MVSAVLENTSLGKIGNVWEGFGARVPDFHPDFWSDPWLTFRSCRAYQNTAFSLCFQRSSVKRNQKSIIHDFNGLQRTCHTLNRRDRRKMEAAAGQPSWVDGEPSCSPSISSSQKTGIKPRQVQGALAGARFCRAGRCWRAAGWRRNTPASSKRA